jgi:hypothetical protein
MGTPGRPGAPFEAWRQWAVRDAAQRGPEGLATLVEGLARATQRIREGAWNDDAERRDGGDVETHGRG